MDPDALRSGPARRAGRRTARREGSAHVGLTNVDHRLRAAFGNDYGLVVETAIGAGTKVVMRVPKFRRASGPAEVRSGEQTVTEPDRARRRRRGARARRAGLPAGRAPRHRPGAAAPPTPPPRCANSTDGHIDAVFLDINMPGLSGIELAGVLANFADPPAVVFVTAHDDKAVAAFDVGAVDYLLKPIRAGPPRRGGAPRRRAHAPDRRAETPPDDATDRRRPRRARRRHPPGAPRQHRLGRGRGRLRAAALGVRSHLVRIPLTTLETRWRDAGFQRVHRSYLVALRLVTGLRTTDGAVLVRLRRQRRLARRRAAGEPPPGP